MSPVRLAVSAGLARSRACHHLSTLLAPSVSPLPAAPGRTRPPLPSLLALPHTRHKSSKSKPAKPSFSLSSDAPVTQLIGKHGSHSVVDSVHVNGPEVVAALQKMDAKMNGIVDWLRGQVGNMEVRASGRVTPAYLDPIRVTLPEGGAVKVEEVATVGVREGSTLVVTVFDESLLTTVHKALSSDKHGLVPQKHDARTIRIPIPRPTAETRTDLVKTAGKLGEEAKVKLRLALQAGKKAIQALGFEKNSTGMKDAQKMTDGRIAEVDEVLVKMKRVMST